MSLRIKAGEVMADVRSAAWLEQELHPELDRHRRHQMADICEEGNVELVWRVLVRSVAEIRFDMLRMLRPAAKAPTVNEPERPAEWRFALLSPPPRAVEVFLKEKVHEYLVASVMADRTAVIIPACSHIWRERASSARSAIRGVAAAWRPPGSAARRPLWPL